MALDRETVVRAALRLLDEAGLDGLTLRKLASELGVQAPALYWHFKSKQDLLDEMAATVFADAIREFGMPAESITWSAWALEYGHRLRQMLLRYRDGAKMYSGRYQTDNALFAPMQVALQKFLAAGFSLNDAASGLLTIYCYVVGFTIEEQAVYPRPGELDEKYDLEKRAERIDSEKLPLALAAGQEAFSRFDERFEKGLQTIVRGLQPAADVR
jgi:TetR/AcrR family transcriptional regulator, tetracycline repressor protein